MAKLSRCSFVFIILVLALTAAEWGEKTDAKCVMDPHECNMARCLALCYRRKQGTVPQCELQPGADPKSPNPKVECTCIGGGPCG